ncbi:MAG: hypothetical protein MHM6MM_004734, partial [Cercozoa sp. M6MM]
NLGRSVSADNYVAIQQRLRQGARRLLQDAHEWYQVRFSPFADVAVPRMFCATLEKYLDTVAELRDGVEWSVALRTDAAKLQCKPGGERRERRPSCTDVDDRQRSRIVWFDNCKGR